MKKFATALFAFVLGAALWQMWPTYAQQLPMLVGQACIIGTQWYPCAPVGLNAANLAGNLAGTGTGTTAQVTAQLNPQAGKTNFICGFTITSTTAAGTGAVNASIVGVMGTTFNFSYLDSGQNLVGAAFPQCLPASAGTAGITVILPADGNRAAGAVNVWGYAQ